MAFGIGLLIPTTPLVGQPSEPFWPKSELVSQRDSAAFQPIVFTVDFGAYPIERRYPLGRHFETFASGWGSLRIDPEMGRAWTKVPPLFKTELQYPISPWSFVYFQLGLRRDLSAWHKDAYGFNLPLTENEVDLNEPSLGYFHAENENFAFTLGRFRLHWSPSPDFGMNISRGVPYHNAAEWMLKTPKIRYRFLVSSLNPWLEGTPAGDSSGTDYPFGSEEYRQRHYADKNQTLNAHKRIYDERIKTLIAHRLEANIGSITLGISESQTIGGKVPDLRDGNPFAFFHNDFKDGYSNICLSFDALVRLPSGLRLFGELLIDDVIYRKTEEASSSASILGYLGGIQHGFSFLKWKMVQCLQYVQTDPYLYGYSRPLNTMASRLILTSNHMSPGGSMTIDKFIIDYPIGYIRGGDALDFWYKIQARQDAKVELSLSIGLLSKGEVDLYTPYESYNSNAYGSPSGIKERELRIQLQGTYLLFHGLEMHAGAGWQAFQNENHTYGQDIERGQVTLGTSWTFPN
jgi:hypothetical protein